MPQPHTQGPLPIGNMYCPCSQCGVAQLNIFNIAVEVTTNYVSIDSEVALLQNILQCETEVYIVYKPFLAHTAFFSYPLYSRKLDIHVVEHESDILHVVNIKSVMGKSVLLPFGRVHIAMHDIHRV